MKKYSIKQHAAEFKVNYEKDLNPEQHAAVMHGEGPALVLAGAGTGKTRVVTYRVARLIEAGVRAENILLLTFTNKAAREMMGRVERLIGRNIFGLWGGTFHHIGNVVLRQHYALAGYRQGFSILDREDSKELFEACVSDLYSKRMVLPKGPVLAEISSLTKNTDRKIPDIISERFPHFLHSIDEIEGIIQLYEKKKRQLNLMDFDDLLLGWKRIFEDNSDIREYYSLKFRHILVDEYQDTNRLQAEIVDLTAGATRGLMVVGDDAQSIYSFRGADFANILSFPEKYKDAEIFKLTTNYRSTPEILTLANRIISGNEKRFQKELQAVVKSGEVPNIVPVRDVVEQAEFISSVVIDLNSEGFTFNEIAALYRSHYQSMELQMEFQRRGIPFEVRSGLKFFEQAHIKDILSYIKVTVNQHDEIGWKRILKLIPGIGKVTASRIWQFIEESDAPVDSISNASRLVPKKAVAGFNAFLNLLNELKGGKYSSSPSGAIDYILRHGYEDYLYSRYPDAEMRIEDIGQMAGFALGYDSLETFLSDMTLEGVADAGGAGTGEDEGRVVLSTVHQAKGLEWRTVFIIGLNDGRFPSAKSLKNDEEDEERRLFYVAVTRAREFLYLCYPVQANDWHAGGFLRPSRFIRELPEECFEKIVVGNV